MDNILGKKIIVTQIRSKSKLTKKQEANLVGLGMINKVLHLINIKLA